MKYNPNKDPAFNCVDCGVNTHTIHEYYMVEDKVWAAANMHVGAGSGDNKVTEEDQANDTGQTGMLCLTCLEKRLDRQLGPSDFSQAPLNWLPFFRRSKLYQKRLYGIS